MATFAYAADGWQTTYSQNTSPAFNDIIATIDVSDTTDGADGTTKYATIQNILGTVITETGDRGVTSADFWKSVRVNSASSETMTLPSVASAEDGATLYLWKIGAGNMVITAADSDTVGDSTDTSITCTSRYILYKLEYCHAATKWMLTTLGDWS